MLTKTFAGMIMLSLLSALTSPAIARIQEYTLVIDRQVINITGKPLKRITVNGSIPGPTLEFMRGDEALIHVTNNMQVDTSVHWHGLLLPGEMDGVPGLNGFAGIRPGATFTYRFKIRQSGTYWYHAHSMGQEQDGHYGSIIIHGDTPASHVADRDYVVLLSDFHQDQSNTILANLKKAGDYYTYTRRTIGDFLTDVKRSGFKQALNTSLQWSKMRMTPSDLSDVGNYTFLINGNTADQNWTGLFKPDERIRLRFINASAMSFYDVRIPGLKMTVISADGQAIEPISVDEFRFGVAETYDVIVTPTENKAFSIVCESLDRSGLALGTLAPFSGMQGDRPKLRQRSNLTLQDMGIQHHTSMGTGMDMAMDMDMDMENVSQADINAHHNLETIAANAGHHHTMDHPGQTEPTNSAPPEQSLSEESFNTGVPGSGWAKTNQPDGSRALAYKDLRYFSVQKDQRQAERDIVVRLGGNMERYIWTLNGKKYADSEPLSLEYGERVRLTFTNDTMMAHPMHLHGMFVQLENGQPLSKLPNKHTIIIAPGDHYSVLLTANEAGEWALHCHLLYHMMAGMMTKIVVATLTQSQVQAALEEAHHVY